MREDTRQAYIARVHKNRPYIQEHLVVAEQVLGRRLRPKEVVHHVNLDRLDNRPENLLVLPSQSEHHQVHDLMMEAFRDAFLLGENPKEALLIAIPSVASLVIGPARAA